MISHQVAQGFIQLGLKTSKYGARMASVDSLLLCLAALKKKKILIITCLNLFFCYRYYKRYYDFQNLVLHLYMHNVTDDRICYLNFLETSAATFEHLNIILVPSF